MKLKYILIISVLIFMNSCSINKSSKNYFFWNSSLTDSDMQNMEKEHVNKCYVHTFDIVPDYVFGAKPNYFLETNLSQTNFSTQIIPTVYIDYKIFYNIKPSEIEDLAQKTYNKINNILYSNSNNEVKTIIYSEIAIDCDWTEKTRELFFTFLKSLKKISNKTITVTIRLHQLADTKIMGIPPADKGILMYYNMDNIKNENTSNSIMDNNTGKQYLSRMDKNYPLKLDLALPVFSWSAVFRSDKFITISHSITSDNVKFLSFLQKIKNNNYLVKKDTNFNKTILLKNDIIRVESPTVDELNKAKEIIEEFFNYKPQIILFSYDQITIQIYNNSNFKHIFNY